MRVKNHLIQCFLFIGLLGCQNLNAASTTGGAQNEESKVLPGELIIRFEPETGVLIEKYLKADSRDLITGIPWLDQLNQAFNLSRIEPLYPQHIDFDAIRKKFPERAKRAPPSIPDSNVNYTYIFHFAGELDLEEAGQAYAANPQVIFIQPNQVIRINQEK